MVAVCPAKEAKSRKKKKKSACSVRLLLAQRSCLPLTTLSCLERTEGSNTCRCRRHCRCCYCRRSSSRWSSGDRGRFEMVFRLQQGLSKVLQEDARRGTIHHEYGRSAGPQLELVHRQRDVLRVVLTGGIGDVRKRRGKGGWGRMDAQF